MALVNTEITHQDQRSDHVKVVFRMTFSNGKTLQLHRRCATIADIPATQTIAEASALEQMKKKAAGKIISEGGAIVADGEASANDVMKMYLLMALREPDMMKAFKLFQRIRTYVQAQGYSWEQVKTFSGMKDKDWNRLKARVDYFIDNYSTINAFIIFSENDPGAE